MLKLSDGKNEANRYKNEIKFNSKKKKQIVVGVEQFKKKLKTTVKSRFQSDNKKQNNRFKQCIKQR